MKNLSNQEQKVYDYLKENPGATTHDITRDTFVQKPCARIVGLKNKGVEIEIVGEVKYPGTHAFKKYAITKPLTKQTSTYHYDEERGVMVERIEEVAV